jgi:hypothetical protein
MNGMSDYSRIGCYLDPLQADRFIPAFSEKIFLDRYRCDLHFPGRIDLMLLVRLALPCFAG